MSRSKSRLNELKAVLAWIAGSIKRPAGSALGWEQWQGTGTAHGGGQPAPARQAGQNPQQHAPRSTASGQ